MSIFHMISEVVVFQGNFFFLGENLVPVAISIHDLLSSCTLQTKFGFEMRRGNTSFIYSIVVIRCNTCISAEDNAMYSASAVLRAISVCRELRQNMGQLAYMITIPVRDMTVSASSAFFSCHPPAKSAST